jgi:hypothetical protein
VLSCWPAFAPAAQLAGAAAVFAFPLQVGAIRTGVMGMYREQAGTAPRSIKPPGCSPSSSSVGIAEAFIRLRG